MSLTVPAEWSPHSAMWLGFPSHAELWEEDLEPAQEEVAALARALAGPGAEHVRLLVHGDAAAAAARRLLDGVAHVEIVHGRFGDIWLRDTGPVFAKRGDETIAVAFRNNGWGGKYELEHDDSVAEQLAAATGVPEVRHDFILEGGSIDGDGFGTVLTTRQCVLNPNRNAGWDERAAELALEKSLGARKLIWLGDGLMNDHTDGHIDNLARFVAPGVVAIPIANGRDDPNARCFDDAARCLAGAKDARGGPLQVMRVPSPGRVESAEGKVIPASHMNFVIANEAVIVPTYGGAGEAEMVETLGALFPERQVIALSSSALLTGGGSFHCITQQEPV